MADGEIRGDGFELFAEGGLTVLHLEGDRLADDLLGRGEANRGLTAATTGEQEAKGDPDQGFYPSPGLLLMWMRSRLYHGFLRFFRDTDNLLYRLF